MELTNSTPRSRPVHAVGFFLVTVLLTGLAPQAASAAPPDKQPLSTLQPPSEQRGFSTLRRSSDAVATKIRTAATSGHAVTIWYVIFNSPDMCSAPCDENDVFNGGDPSAGFNVAQITAAMVSVVYGGDGGVVNRGGRLALDGGLVEGQVPTGSSQVVIGRGGDGALVPISPVTGLVDAQTAEIHVVLQEHGPAHTDPTLLEQQLSGFRTACNPTPVDCADVQFAIHVP